jgi:hypothetical protein
MVSEPAKWIDDFAKAGANMFTFHLEAAADPAGLSASEAHPAVVELCRAVRAAGMEVGPRRRAARVLACGVHAPRMRLSAPRMR